MSQKTIINTDKAPAAIGPYSQAVIAPAGKTVFFIRSNWFKSKYR